MIQVNSRKSFSIIQVLGIGLVLFFMLLPSESIVAALPIIEIELALNKTQAGSIYSSYLLGYILAALFIVPLSDKLGTKSIMLFSVFIYIISNLIFPGIYSNLLLATLVRAFGGVGMVGSYMCGLRLIAQSVEKKHRGFAVGVFVTSQYMGHSFSLAFSGVLMSFVSWTDMYYFLSFLAIFSFPLLLILTKKINSKDNYSSETLGKSSIIIALKNLIIRNISLSYSLHALILYGIRTWLPYFIFGMFLFHGTGDGFANDFSSIAAGLILIFGGFGPILGGVVSDFLGRPNTIMAISCVSVLCCLILGWFEGIPIVVKFFVLLIFSLCFSGGSPIYSTVINETTGKHRLGDAIAAQASIGLLGGLLGPIILCMFFDNFKSEFGWSISFSFIAILSIIVFVLMLQVKSFQKRELRSSSD